jgi:beta-exotoxin I transport system permease protein
MRTVYRKALWDQRKVLPAWASGLALIILLESAMWPSIESMPSLEAYLDDFPPALKELFALEEMVTGTGFLNAELFTLSLPLMFLIYGITRGARMIAGEEESGTLDLLLVTPLSATRLLVQEALALTTGVALLGVVVVVATVVGSAAFGLDIDPRAALAGSLAITLLGVEFGVAALVTGALTGRRSLALGVASGLAMAAYVLFVAGLFVDDLATWRGWSPFEQALHAGPLSAEVPVSFGWLAIVPVVVCAVSLPLWARRDVGAAR